jgi:hypothetical protein
MEPRRKEEREGFFKREVTFAFLISLRVLRAFAVKKDNS